LAERKAAVAQDIAQYVQLRPTSDATSQRLMGMDAIQQCLKRPAREASSECLSVMPGGAQSQASLDESRPLDVDALERGVSILTLYQDSVRNDPATYTYARWLTERGGQVRTAPLLPPRMLIFDRHTAVVPIDPAIVASLVVIYEHAWETAIPLGATNGEPDDS
jgi:hypothetical protein